MDSDLTSKGTSFDQILGNINDEHCSFYKKLVVEEVSLCEYPHMVHYGKCSIIGTITCCESGVYHLNNIKLKSIDKELQIPSNSESIILLDTLILGMVQIGTTCEAFGEIVLYDSKEGNNVIPKTSKDLKMELINFISNGKPSETKLKLVVEEMKARYRPAIRVHSLCIVDQPQELIECNLAIRNLNMRKYNLT